MIIQQLFQQKKLMTRLLLQGKQGLKIMYLG